MVKYYSYRSILDRKKKNRKKKIKVFLFIVVSVIIVFLFEKFIAELIVTNEIFKIKSVSIYLNTTTIPDTVIYECLGKRNLSVFNFYRVVKDLKKIYPEIKEIRIQHLLTKNPKLKIIGFAPICYNKINNNFFSNEIGWFKVYDLNKIDYNNLFEVEYMDYIDDYFVKNIYFKFNSLHLNKCIKKLYFKNSSECYLFLTVGNGMQEILIDDSFHTVEESKLYKFINYIANKNVKVYGRLLSEGKMFVE